MSSAFASVLAQRPPGPATVDESGIKIPRRWSVIATSELAAYTLLRNYGVFRGAVFTEANGLIPQPIAILQRMTIVGKPAAVSGGFGQYICDGEYSSQQGVQQPIPGGPAVFSIRNSLTSTPVDVDAQGNLIVTSSEEPLDPPLTMLRPEETLHADFYVKAKSAIDAYIPLRPYNGALNATVFFGASRGCILSHVFQPQSSDTGWVRVGIDFQYKAPKKFNGKVYEGWHDIFPDRGTRTIINRSASDPAKRYQNITVPDSDGNKTVVDHPYPLDGKGKQQSPNANPVLIDVNNYNYMNFNSIPGMRFS